MSRDTSLRSEDHECLKTRDGRKTAENPRNKTYLRFRDGFCWSCMWDKTENKLRSIPYYMGVQINPLNIKWECGEMWEPQVYDLERKYGLPRLWIPALETNPADSEADLGRILNTLSARAVGLSEVFTSRDYCITSHDTGEQAPFRRARWW